MPEYESAGGKTLLSSDRYRSVTVESCRLGARGPRQGDAVGALPPPLHHAPRDTPASASSHGRISFSYPPPLRLLLLFSCSRSLRGSGVGPDRTAAASSHEARCDDGRALRFWVKIGANVNVCSVLIVEAWSGWDCSARISGTGSQCTPATPPRGP